jgi:phosphoglycerate dehydrogenase-like enzyme
LVRAGRLPALRVRVARDERQTRTLLPSAELLLADPGRVASRLHTARRLRWVQSTWAGVEDLIAPCRRLGVPLTAARGMFGPLIRDYVLAYVLAIERRLFETRDDQRRRRWSRCACRGVYGLEIGVMGLGTIGREVARACRRLGMQVRGLSLRGSRVAGVPRVYPAGRLGDFLNGLDYLVAALPLTSRTRSMFNARFFRRLGPRAVFINVGRGGQVVEADLARALRRGELRGAVLDVFEREPLPRRSPLWRLPGLLLTPHNAAVSFPEQVAPLFIANYRRYIAGRPLLHRVDLERGY